MGFRWFGQPRIFGERLGNSGTQRTLQSFLTALAPILSLDDLSDVYQDAGTTPATGTDPVGQWNDRSGNAEHATQSGAPRPVLGTINGLRAVNFDGAADYLVLTLTHAASNYTAFIVFEPDDVPTTAQYLMDFQTGRLILAHGTASGSGDGLGYFDSVNSWEIAGAQTSGAQLVTFQLQSAASGKVFRNGTQVGSDLNYSQRALGGTQDIGAIFNGSGSFYDGRIGAIYLFDKILAAADRAMLETLIMARWGL